MPKRSSSRRPKKNSRVPAKSRRIAWKAAALALAKCAVFALKFDKHLGRGSGVVVDLKNGGAKSMGPWQDMFFDALEGIGVCYDRKKYYADRAHRRRA
jgi:hypothetical protein